MAGVVDDGRGTLTRRRAFAQVPDDLVTDPRVTDFALRVWCRLDRYAGLDGRAFPSIDRLQADFPDPRTGRPSSARRVKYAIRCLVDTGWITRTRRGMSNIIDTFLNDEPVTCKNHASPQVSTEVQISALPKGEPVACEDAASVQVSTEVQISALPKKETHKQDLKETKSGVDQSRSDLTTQTCARPKAAARRPRARKPAPGSRGTWEHLTAWSIIGRRPELISSPLRFEAARVLITYLVEVPEGDRDAAVEQLDSEMAARAPSTGPDGPSDAFRAASEAVAVALRAPDTPEAIRGRLAASQAPPAPKVRPGRCPVHEVALTAAGVCPCCRADQLAGLYDAPAPEKPPGT